MKRTNLLYYALLAGVLLGYAACKKSFLTAQPEGTQLESNYYQSPDEAFAGLVAAYNPLSWTVVSSYAPKMVLLTLASDEATAGGGSNSDNPGMQAWNTYTLNAATPNVPPDLWSRNFTGIFRVNTMLQKVGSVPGLSSDLKTRYTAEMQFLRAYYYFDLVREFGNVPLITAVLQQSQFFTQTQAKPADVYAQIEKDLNAAIPNLPATVDPATEGGRVTKGAAQALLGK
ncbi:MAG TPA: RagB/SusD family nutrient uptake outer membrane protein, partial [Puia sp.]|nr:RagB/SusD family nutrient uptake outer membrane protein [Puia sp.]